MINNFKEDYAFLSNFYEVPVTYEGLTYQNNEAAFQSAKCINKEDRKQFVNLTPSEAKHLGRKIPLRSDWEQVKISIMEEIVKNKFEENGELREKLLATGDEYLEEGNTWGDRVWGTVDGKGANNLGKILMKVRSDIRNSERK
ncbi:MAG: NADAR family protein [Catonella sp.]|nr:NADAR family protein [Catonella sp.]MDY6356264.1 NADAR family protein [Catonella sp.]